MSSRVSPCAPEVAGRPGGAPRALALATAALLFVGLLPALTPVAAQTTAPSAARLQFLVAGDEQSLWLLQVNAATSETAPYHRGRVGAFARKPPLKGRVVQAVVAESVLYCFLEDGAFYSLAGTDWARGLDLPGRALPLDFLAVGPGLFALVPSPTAAGMPRAGTTQPFDPGGGTLSLIRYENQGWGGVAPCPPTIPAEVAPRATRLIPLGRSVGLMHQPAPDGPFELLELQDAAWRPGPATPSVTADHFWCTVYNRTPAMLIDGADSEPGQLRLYRLLGGGDGEAPSWRAIPLQVSPLPSGREPARVLDVLGFNQHLVLHTLDTEGHGYLRFARAAEAPAEPTLAIADLLAQDRPPPAGICWMTWITPLVIAAVLAALFVFRRGALVAPVVLPAGFVLARTFQRVLGLLLDLGLVAIPVARVMGIDWQAGVRELLTLALGPDPAATSAPSSATFAWWAVSISIYTFYTLVAELLARRTLGKLLVGTHVLGIAGAPATPVQIIVRNVLRAVELMPHLWLLGFLVVVSRNNQRLGDIFAKTVVVRRVAQIPPPE